MRKYSGRPIVLDKLLKSFKKNLYYNDYVTNIIYATNIID